MDQATAAGARLIERALAPALAAASAVAALTAVSTRTDGRPLARLGSTAGASRRHPSRRHPSPWPLAARVGRTRLSSRLSGRDHLGRRLALAGSLRSVDELIGAKAVLAVGAGGLALLAPGPGLLLAPVLVAAGFRAPDLVVAARARRRVEAANRELPQLLDLLAAASSAGLSGQLALRNAVSATEGPLADELGTALRAVDLGARWRDELRAVADRLGLPDLRRAVGSLTRTGSLGTSLAEAMTQLAAEVREERRAALSERARKAPVKMLFPLVFLVLPAFLLLTVVPVLLTTLRSIR